ncbi:hypothetical protein M8J77_008366 [Diaphorina citri]|nr:hypothetical protein M8J77_008366 [Diaphorina citri]
MGSRYCASYRPSDEGRNTLNGGYLVTGEYNFPDHLYRKAAVTCHPTRMYSPCTATFHSAEKFNSEGTMKPFQQSPASNETITSNEEDMMRSLEFLKHILESQYVRGDRVCIKNLFLHISKASKAPPKIQICCGKDIKDFKKFLSKFPETFLVKNNYVSLNVYKDGDPNIEMIENLVSAQRAVDEISQYKEIGLKLQGSLWGMTGKVSLLALKVPPGKIFIFDMVKCPTALTGTNLAGVLESQEILKVAHNCQNDAAALLGNYGVQLRNVFDTQCAFKTFQYTNPQMLDDNLSVHYLGLNNLLDYYEFSGNKLVQEQEEMVKKAIKKNPNVWQERPLSEAFIGYAAQSVSPLLIIYYQMKGDRALKVNKVLFQNLVYEELFRFAIPLIVKRRQNVRQTSLRSWKRQMANERRYIPYIERTNNKDQIWKNDYTIAPHVPAKTNKNIPGPNAWHDAPKHIQDLDTKYFIANNKRYYFDIKEQNGVKFVKISEVSSIDQSRNLISINVNLVAKFRDYLVSIQQFRKPTGRGNVGGRGTSLIHSLSIVKDTRRYLIDLKRNHRGYFVTISQMLPTGGKLSSIAFGIRDLSTFIEILNDIGQEFGVDETSFSDGNYMRFRNKRYFFNVNQNDRGTFMRISEVVSPNYQSSMTIAEKTWDDFIEKFTETCEAFRRTRSHREDDSALQRTIDEK